MSTRPRILHTETVAKSRLFEIESRQLRFSNGVEVQYERIVGAARGAVLIVPMLDDDTVLLIREYAAGVHRYELGLPKGLVEPGEDVLKAANREMMEEVGYAARELQPLHTLSLAPGYFDFSTHLVLARDLYQQRAEGDEPEAIEVVPWKLDRIDELLARDDFSEARSVAALFLTRHWLAHGSAR